MDPLPNKRRQVTGKIRKCRHCGKEYKLPGDYPGTCSIECRVARVGSAKPRRRKIGDGFYLTREWHRLRYKAFKIYGPRCCLCGATNTELHVDHIKPRSKFPDLELILSNLQILCRACNLGKGASDCIQWRD